MNDKMAEVGKAPSADKLSNTWIESHNLKTVADTVGTPAFVYSEAHLIKNVRRIKHAALAAGLDQRVELFVPFFPNSNPHVIKPFQQLNVGVLLQLPAEYKLLHGQHGFNKFIISPGHVSDADIDYWAPTGDPVFLSSLDEISYLIKNHPKASINVRLDSLGSGKPGIKYSQLGELRDLLDKNNRKLNCFELYCGSGNSLGGMVGILEQVFMIHKTYFPEASAINFAGGYAFVYEEIEEEKKHFEWDEYFVRLREIAKKYGVGEHVKFWFEPARDLLGDCAALLLSVKREPIRNPGNYQVLTNGSRVLIPSAQYKERHHNVKFLDKNMKEIPADKDAIDVAIRGRGILRHDYVLPGEYTAPSTVGPQDYVLVMDVGCYCATQHMEFLNIPPAAEVVIDTAGKANLITAPGGEMDKWRHVLPEKKPL